MQVGHEHNPSANPRRTRRFGVPAWSPGRRFRRSLVGTLVALLAVSCHARTPIQPGETLNRTHPARSIRVLILDDVDRFVLTVACPLHVRGRDGQELCEPMPPLQDVPILVRRGSSTALLVGGKRFSADLLDLVPERDGAIEVLMPAGPDRQTKRRYTGFLRCVLNDDGTADLINVVDVEDYLRGVLRGEVPPNWHDATYQAQAIAARTYVLYEKGTVGRHRNWDVTSTARSQMFIGVDPAAEKTKAAKAVSKTCGLVCTYPYPEGDRIFCTYYAAVCGGSTQDASLVNNVRPIPPLGGGVKCEHCWRAPRGTYRWEPVTFTKKHIGRALAERYQAFRKLGPVVEVRVAARCPEGRARTIRVLDSAGTSADISAEAFRLTVDPTGMILKSTHFRIRDDGASVSFTHGRGWGHGLGMCQWGAEGMARAGATAAKILAHYYPKSQLTKVYD